MKARLIGALLALGLAGVLAAAALAATAAPAKRAASIKVGVSLAGYSTDFWSSYVAFEKQAAKTTTSRWSGRSRRTATRASRPPRSRT